MFFSSMFRLDPRNIHKSGKVEIDVVRTGEPMAVPIPSVSTGPRANEASKFVNKAFTPPIFDEMGPIEAWEQINRQPGQNPFEDPDFARSAGTQAMTILRLCSDKVARATEFMASQVMQTGKISLIDQNGNVVYVLDFVAKTSHLVTTTTWASDGTTGDPLTDIANIATTIRQDGKVRADKLIFGKGALQRFMANAKVKTTFDKRIFNLADFEVAQKNEDATYMGPLVVDNYMYEMWRYDGQYEDVQSGTLTPYMADNKVVVASSKGRLDMTYGAIPMFVPPDGRVVQFLPPKILAPDKGIFLTTNAWLTPNGKSMFVSAGARPLPIPTQIDSTGCLTVY